MTTTLSALSRRGLLAGGVGAALAAPFLVKGFGARAQGGAKPIKIAWNGTVTVTLAWCGRTV